MIAWIVENENENEILGFVILEYNTNPFSLLVQQLLFIKLCNMVNEGWAYTGFEGKQKQELISNRQFVSTSPTENALINTNNCRKNWNMNLLPEVIKEVKFRWEITAPIAIW